MTSKITRLSYVGLGLVLSLAIVACGDDTDDADGIDDENGTDETTDADEGSVVLYTMHGPEITDPVLSGFEDTYPEIDLEMVEVGGTGETISRIEAESDNPSGDVMWGGDKFVYEGSAHLFRSAELENDEHVVEQDPEGIWHATDLLFQTVHVNTDLLPEESDHPSTFEDLIEMDFGGEIAFANPRNSGTSYSLLLSMLSLYGWDYVEQFVDNARVLDGSGEMFEYPRDGENPVGFINEDIGGEWESQGVPIRVIHPEDGVSNQIGSAGLIDGGPNPDQGETLVNYLMSEQAQTILSEEVGRRPSRLDVDPPEGLPAVEELDLVDFDQEYIEADEEELLDQFDEILEARD